MRIIKLKSLSLVNFKGIRSQQINFSESVTTISGENGSGKTTIFDAFMWLLFGKDSFGRSDSNFNIKTLDENGKPILHLEHSVTGVLDVDGREIKLQRSYCENWVKSRGSIEEQLKSHNTEYYLNDVKLATKKEYDSEISAIVPEDVFKMVTNPYYFTSLKPEVQKEMLLDMSGGVSDSEVAALSEDYVALLAEINGGRLSNYLSTLCVKMNAIKNELELIPSQIETANNLMPEIENWAELNAELEDKRAKVADIDSQIADMSKVNEAELQRKLNLQKQISDKSLAIEQRKAEIKAEIQNSSTGVVMEIRQEKMKLDSLIKELEYAQGKQNRVNRHINEIEGELNTLRAEFKAINAESLNFDENAFICPTCKRPLEIEDIQAKQQEMAENFNQSKAKRLAANKEKGLAKAAQLKTDRAVLEDVIAEIDKLNKDIEQHKANIEGLSQNAPKVLDANELIAQDSMIIQLTNEVNELENQRTMNATPADTSDLVQAKQVLNENIQELILTLAKQKQIEKVQSELDRLEEKKIANSQKLADLEKWQYTALNFQKDKDAKLLEKINQLFKYVSFTFLKEQMNGGEKISCICTVNGTPYQDVNAAGKLNAGLDIINAICTTKGIEAPIFIDNRESVNDILPTASQVVNLVVSRDKVLTIN